MSEIIRGIAKRLGQHLVWMSMTEEERLDETRKKTLAIFHQQWTEASRLADSRFTYFQQLFDDYRGELEKVRKLDTAHEGLAREKFRTNPVPGLSHYLEEPRPHLTAQEMIVVDYYRSAVLAWRELHNALDALCLLKNALYYSNVLERSTIIDLYRARADEYNARQRQLQPLDRELSRYSYADSHAPANKLDDIAARWRANQNRRRHALS